MGEQDQLGRRLCFKGRVVDVFSERVRLPNQALVELDLIEHPGGAAVVAVDDAGRLCLLRQYRHAAKGWLWELPAGKLDPGERPQQTAERELIEEAGVAALRWDSLGQLQSSPGVLTEVIHLFLARDLQSEPMAHEHGELIEVHWLDFPAALAWARSGEITDAKTLIGIFRAAAMLHERAAAALPTDEF